MSNPVFIVDGFTEMKIIQRVCPKAVIRRTDLNGKDVTLSAICNAICRLIRALGNRYYPVIILIDKENRNITCEEMCKCISGSLKLEFPDQDIRVGIADRMIENWMISDWDTLCEGKVTKEKKPINPDGKNGAAIIKKIKGSYSKTADGVEYFLKNNPKTMYKNSNSFRHFIDSLEGVDCYFLTTIAS